MLFWVIGITFSFIFYISLFGNYVGKEKEEWKKRWKRIMGVEYYGD